MELTIADLGPQFDSGEIRLPLMRRAGDSLGLSEDGLAFYDARRLMTARRPCWAMRPCARSHAVGDGALERDHRLDRP
jgi:hypothetical protein